MRKLYPLVQILFCICTFFPKISKCQCILLDATFTTYESRCAATGAIKVRTTGGSGNYKYKTTGPVNTNFTTSDSITGLSAGTYSLVINDIVSNCTLTIPNVVVAGTYQDPRFTLTKIDVSCDHASNGSIIVDGFSFGRAPYQYSIVAPSPMGVGTTNSSGAFSGLAAGDYSIKMTDSCGGIQTRQITIVDYSWWIDAYSFTKTSCDEASGFIKVVDSRGNISTVGGIPDFTYGIVRAPGDTIWSNSPNFSFSLLGHTTFDVIARDACGIIKKASVRLSLAATASANVNTYGYLCNSFSASLSVGTNFLTPDFCLYDSSDALISCNTTGSFNGLTYGRYCIKAHDACTDTTITRCFQLSAPPVSVSNSVIISHKTCTDFTAGITGQNNLTNPEYCLYDSANLLIECNTTGVFNGLSYQPYCITTRDGCRDTIITRCFNPHPPLPIVPDVIVPLYINCVNFGINAAGDSLTDPVYCLYDTSGVLIDCNHTGIFDSIPLGNYCVTIYDACYDTTFTRCLEVLVPVIHNDMVIITSNKTCNGFTIEVSSNNINPSEYCLYNASDVLISCNSHGIFNNIPYGDYCIKARAACPDTLLISCISVRPNIPSVGSSVQISHRTCTSFSAEIQQVQNFTSPIFCIYDDQNVLIRCNTTGLFTNLNYGSYCIKISDDCYDTTITKCFNQAPIKVSLTGNAGKSCSVGWAQFNLNLGGNSGYLPVTIMINNPDGSLFSQQSYNSNSVLVDSIPGVASGQFYTVIASDNCGNRDTLLLGSTASFFNHSPTVQAKCPSGVWASGSGNIKTTVSTNMGSLTVKIIKKNGISYFPTLSANTVAAGVYSFIDFGPGTYIISYSENSCNKKLYDTVVVASYTYPNLNRSSAYQCDVNGFSVSAVATNGVGPFTYEIIGSQPVTPSIVTGPQASPIFTINNGSNYSLIRLRALDACGNATLGDASILPLAINGMISAYDCIDQPTTLSIDSLYNSTYRWYKKTNEQSTDSILIGNGTSYYIPTVLPSDTGFYVCYVSVNSGCINRTFNFHIGGNCWIVLPVKLEEFKGQSLHNKNLLTWKTTMEEGLEAFVIERRTGIGSYTAIGTVTSYGNSTTKKNYSYTDHLPLKGKNEYRLKMKKVDNSFSYSNVVVLNNVSSENIYSIFPNPVKDVCIIDFRIVDNHHYKICLYNSMNQLIKDWSFINDNNARFEINRPAGLQKGMYILHITDSNKKQSFQMKLIFL